MNNNSPSKLYFPAHGGHPGKVRCTHIGDCYSFRGENAKKILRPPGYMDWRERDAQYLKEYTMEEELQKIQDLEDKITKDYWEERARQAYSQLTDSLQSPVASLPEKVIVTEHGCISGTEEQIKGFMLPNKDLRLKRVGL